MLKNKRVSDVPHGNHEARYRLHGILNSYQRYERTDLILIWLKGGAVFQVSANSESLLFLQGSHKFSRSGKVMEFCKITESF